MKKNEQGAIDLMLVAALVVVIAVGGFVYLRISSTADDVNTQASIDDIEQDEEADALTDDLASLKSLDEIQALAADDAAGEDIVGIELDTEDGRTYYVVHLGNGSTLVYDAVSGEALEIEVDSFDGENALPANFTTGITIQKAIEIAQEKRPNSTVEKVEIEVEDGKVVFSVRFTDDSRVDVLASDGTIQRLRDEAGNDSRSSSEADDSDDDSNDSSKQRNDDDHDDSDHEEDDDHGEDDSDDDHDDDQDDPDNSGSGSRN